MNNAINEIKNTLEGTNSRITESEDRISEVEDRMAEINEANRKKEKRIEMRKISWTKEPGGLQSMGSQRVGHN